MITKISQDKKIAILKDTSILHMKLQLNSAFKDCELNHILDCKYSD